MVKNEKEGILCPPFWKIIGIKDELGMGAVKNV